MTSDKRYVLAQLKAQREATAARHAEVATMTKAELFSTARLTEKALRNLPKWMTTGLTVDTIVAVKYLGPAAGGGDVYRVTRADGFEVGNLNTNCLTGFVL